MTHQTSAAPSGDHPVRSQLGNARGGWTDAAVAALMSLWADDGLSAAVIARRLGVSRNAVLGKVHRLGLSNRRQAAKARPRPSSRSAKVPRTSAHHRGPLRARTVAAAAGHAATDPGPGLVAHLEDLPRGGCRWPLGDPKSEAFRFCGRPAPAAPYCEAHRAIAYRPGGPRSPLSFLKEG